MARKAPPKSDAKQPRKTARKTASTPKKTVRRKPDGRYLHSYDPNKASEIVRLMSDSSVSLRKACETTGVAKGTFLGWVVDDIEGIGARYERARKVRAWAMLDELIEIADDGVNDYVEQVRQDGTKHVVCDREHVQRSKLRCDQRQWALARILRKEFGDKVQLSGDPDGAPIKTDAKITVEFVKPAVAPQPMAH
jgi:hypothetical protein